MLAHESSAVPEDSLRPRHLRARGAVFATLNTLREAYARFDSDLVGGDEVAALVRRWIEGQTFAPQAGDDGVHLVDADSARFGQFEHVHIAGLVENEWPDRAKRSIFYSTSVLRELGWPVESDRLAGARAAFADLLRLPTSRLSVSTFLLEADALVSPSPFDRRSRAVGSRLRGGSRPVSSNFRSRGALRRPHRCGFRSVFLLASGWTGGSVSPGFPCCATGDSPTRCRPGRCR